MVRNSTSSGYKRSIWKRAGYRLIHVLSRIFFRVFYRIRCTGREHEPTEGGALICSNHQSFFDPVLVGLTFQRRINPLARKSLFRFFLFRWLIEFLDAIPIDRDGVGLGGLKESLKRLKRGEFVLIFPEGTRTKDGELLPIKPGFVALARRGKVPIIPVAFDGAYQAWPRDAKLPRLSRIAVDVGEPISADQIAGLSDEELVEELQNRMTSCFEQARRTT